MRSALGAIVIALVGALALAPTNAVLACSCVGVTAAQALASADVAFVGVAAAVQKAGGAPAPDRPPLDNDYLFVVEKLQKGAVDGNVVHIESASSGASCGAGFEVGDRWQVYARAQPNVGLVSTLCSGNERLDVDVPVPALAPPATPDSSGPADLLTDAAPWLLGGFLLLLAVSMVAFVGRAPRKLS